MISLPRIPTLGNLPDYDSEFRPWGFLPMRPVWWRRSRSHILCGDPGSGKTTFISSGMHELAGFGIYKADHLKIYPSVRKTQAVSRFSLERLGVIPVVDSWIDADGESFRRCFDPAGRPRRGKSAMNKACDWVNSMIILVSAQQLMDLNRHLAGAKGGTRESAENYIDGIREVHRWWKPGAFEKVKRAGFRWHLVVSQCGDVLHSRHDLKVLQSALREFGEKTGLRASCRRAILIDSMPGPLQRRRVPVAMLGQGLRGGLRVDTPEARICSAGVAMAIILNRLRCGRDGHNFILPLSP